VSVGAAFAAGCAFRAAAAVEEAFAAATVAFDSELEMAILMKSSFPSYPRDIGKIRNRMN
jgi:hypothetical protein